ANSVIPATPTNVGGMGVSSTSIQLTWTSPSPNNATGIKIFRSTNGTTYTQVNTVAATATSYIDTGLSQTNTHYYQIAATNQVGDSPQTDPSQLTPAIIPPALTLDNFGSTSVSLVWTRPPVANDHYSVERSNDPTFATFTTVATNLPGNQPSYIDTDPFLA